MEKVNADYYFTRQQFMDLAQVTKQAVSNRIRRGTLKTIVKTIPVETELIVLTEDELQNIQRKKQ